MADRAARGGRARGRASKPQAQQAAPAAPAPAAAPRPAAGPPPGMAPPKPAPTSSGRAMHRGAGRPMDDPQAALVQKVGQMSIGDTSSGNGNGNGNGAPVGRGNMRGKRQIFAPPPKTRPEKLSSKKGVTGTPVVLYANYFSLVSTPQWALNQYRVDFKPSIDETKERKRLLRYQAKNIGCEYIFDGTVLFTSKRTNLPHLANQEVEFFSQREDGSQIQITIRLVGDLQMGDHQYIQFFNILTRKCLQNLNLQLIQRDYYDPEAKVMVPDFYLELWPGYKTTIHQYENEVLMCAEITHKVMRTDTCLHLLNDIAKARPQNYKEDFMKNIVGTVVLTDYNNKTYVVSDVNWDETPAHTFPKNDGTRITYVDYYREKYSVNIKAVHNQPLLVTKIKPRERRAAEQTGQAPPGDPKNTYLIPELCRMTGLTDSMRANFKLMQAMAAHTRIGPEDRIKRLLTMNRRLNSEERIRKEFHDWDLKLSERLVEIKARVLPAELIVLGNNISVPSGEKCDWTQKLRSNPMFVMPQGGLSRWVIIFPQRLGNDAQSFVQVLQSVSKGMQFRVAAPEPFSIPDDRTNNYVSAVDNAISSYNPQLIFVVLTNNKADRYSAIKKKSLVDRAVPTQVLLAKNLTSKGVQSIATKVAIQLNCKIGGAPWSVQMPLGGLMVIGFDVCHDSKQKGKSFGAMVASLNKPMSRYFSAVSHHETGEELSNHLAINVVKAMQSYKKHNSTFPSHIIIYRDGVGDGQIPYVFEHEVAHLQRAIGEVIQQTPKLGFVIVSKKINTRFFEKQNNPRPGTVVDDVVTLPERYDFFIVSQFVNQGTVSPTSYNVIHDTTGLDPDKMQRLTFKMTHIYYNWSGTVRVPAPVQYAHKLAFLVSQAIFRPPNSSLEELLYFL